MKKIFTLFAALTLSVGLWAEGSVFTYTATKKLETEFNQLGTVATHEFSNGAGTVTYSSTVTTIRESAFASSNSLQSITIPASVTTIGKNAFEVCYSLTSVTFLGNACTIGKSAFNYVGTTDKPATLVLPANWTGEKPVDSQTAWYGGYFKLETPAPVEYKYTTYENWQIKYGSAWQWSGNMEKVEDGLFKLEILWEGTGFNVKSDANPIKQDWIAPEELTIGEEVIAPINVDVYLQVIDDETVKIGVGCKPAKPAPVVGETFEDETSGLKFEVTATDETNTVKVVYNSYAGTSYTIPATVTYKETELDVTAIGEMAFFERSDITSITFAEGSQITVFEMGAFFGCEGLTSFNIPATVDSIAAQAIAGCYALTDVTVNWTSVDQLPAMGENVFIYIAKQEDETSGPQYATLHVPAGTKAIYKAADQWKDFGTIDDPAIPTTFNVTVPAGTDACYLVGTLNAWNIGEPIEMTKVDDTHYTYTDEFDLTGAEYKYVHGATWDKVEKNADGSEMGNRVVDATVMNDTVEKWADATALFNVDSEFKIQNSKFIKDGQMLIRKGGKNYNALGAEL